MLIGRKTDFICFPAFRICLNGTAAAFVQRNDKMKKLLWMAAFLVILGLCAAAGAEEWTVSPQGMSLEEALAQCQDGDVILLDEGVYAQPREHFPLTVTRRVTLRPAEGAHAVIDAPQLQSALRIEADGVTLEGLEIRLRHIGLYAIGNDMKVHNCAFVLADPAWRTSSCAIWLGGIYRAELSGCDFTGCGPCMAGPPISERSISLQLPVLTGMFEVGEEIEFFTTHTITDCRVNGKPLYYIMHQERVEAPRDAGMLLCVNCGQVLAEGLDVSDSSMGMEIVYCQRVHVENCRADRCGIFGIYLAKCGQGLVKECTVAGTNHGIDIRACENVTLLRCAADQCEQGLFFSKVNYSAMIDCTVTETGQGIFTAGGYGNLFCGCRVSCCENGFNIQKDTEARLIDNEIMGCTVCGVRLDRSPTVFSGNTVRENWTGVMAYGGVPFVIQDNLFDGNRSCGLFLRGIAYSQIVGNRFRNHEKTSVDARGDMAMSLWADNELDLPITAEKTAVFDMQ